MNTPLKLLLVVPTLFLLACGGGGGGPTGPIETPDAGSAPTDSGQNTDAGVTPEDGGSGDAGSTPVDGGSGDAGSTPEDGGSGDAGSTPVDGGPGDAGSTTGDGGTDGGTVDAGTQTPPPAPTLIGTQPDSTGSEPQPLALGTAEPGTTVELFDSFTCAGVAMATGTASAEGLFSIRFPATRNGATYLTAKARRGALVSGCSTTWKQYTHDDRVPQVVEVTPAINATNVAPTVAPVARFSESVAEASVKLEVSCGGQAVAGTVGVSGSRATFTPSASLPEQVTCTVTVREAADLAGNALAAVYSWSFTTMRVPNPNPPSVTGTTPTSPGTSTTPSVLGQATAGLTVELFTTTGCTSGTAVASGAVNASGNFSIQVTVPANGSTTFRAQAVDSAGRRSTCSTSSATYVHDSVVPTVLSVSPAANATGVTRSAVVRATLSEAVRGVASDLTLRCGDQTLAGTTTFSGAQVTLDPTGSLPYDATCTATLAATVTDLAGNPLAAAHSWSFSVEQSPAPNTPSLTGTTPTSPGNSTTPNVRGGATPGLTVELFTTSDCSGTVAGSGTSNTSGAFSIPVTVAAHSSTTFRAQAINATGRRSVCSTQSTTYVHDGVAPTLVSVTPAADATGVLRGSVVRATLSETTKGVASDLTLRCAGQSVSGTTTFSGAQVTFDPASPLPYDTTCTATLAATVTDAANNPLGTAHSWSFAVEQSPPPNMPSLTSVNPSSPGRSTTPSVWGGATPGVTVELFTTSDCSGTVVGSGTPTASGTFTIPVTVATNSSTTFRAQAISAVGRRSACSTQSVTYTHDDVAPTLVSTRPAAEAVDVETNTVVTANFSEPVRNTSGTLSVQCGGAAVQGSVSISGAALSFTSTQPLPFDVSCTARVTTGVSDLAGNPLAAEHSWSFTMRESPVPGPPTLSRTDPTSPGNSVTPTVVGTATAGHLIELYTGDDCSGTPVASGTVDAQGRFAIPVTVNTNATTLIRATARVRPSRPSSPCTQALLYRHDGVLPTVASVSPVNDATDVQPAAMLFADFSELIFAQAGDVVVRCAGTLIPGTVSVSQRRLTFAPLVQLWMEESCTATVGTGVRDEAGNTLAVPYSWAFTTRPYGWSQGPVVATVSGGPTSLELGLGNAGEGVLVWRGDRSPYATTRHELNLNSQQGTSAGLVLNTVSSSTPVVATSPNGHSVVAWLESASGVPTRLLATVFIPGTGWSTPAVLSTSGLGPRDPQVAIDNSGQALVVFRQHPNSSLIPYSLYAQHFRPGTGWWGPTEIDDVAYVYNDMKEASVTRDGRGGFLVVWNGEFDRGNGTRQYLFFNWLRAGSTPGSMSWTGARYFFEIFNPGYPRAGCDAQGNCIIVYEGQASDARAIRYDAAAVAWEDPVALGPTGGSTEGFGIAVNATGQAVAAFSHYSSTQSAYEVLVRQYEPGVGWSEPRPVGPLTGAGGRGFFDVGIDAQGNAVVLSRQYSVFPAVALYASRFQVGVGWLPAEEIDTDVGWSTAGSDARAYGPRVAMNASGRILIGYWKGNTVYSRWME